MVALLLASLAASAGTLGLLGAHKVVAANPVLEEVLATLTGVRDSQYVPFKISAVNHLPRVGSAGNLYPACDDPTDLRATRVHLVIDGGKAFMVTSILFQAPHLDDDGDAVSLAHIVIDGNDFYMPTPDLTGTFPPNPEMQASWGVDIMGVTTTGGNVPTTITAMNRIAVYVDCFAEPLTTGSGWSIGLEATVSGWQSRGDTITAAIQPPP